MGQPVSDTTLKVMLLSLRASLKPDLLSSITHCKLELQELGDRVGHMEDKMCEVTTSFNALVDSHADHWDELASLRAKVADLEDRACQNNMKIRGIPESV